MMSQQQPQEQQQPPQEQQQQPLPTTQASPVVISDEDVVDADANDDKEQHEEDEDEDEDDEYYSDDDYVSEEELRKRLENATSILSTATCETSCAGLADDLPDADEFELDIKGFGPVRLPLIDKAQVDDLIKHAKRAPFGKGETTLVDRNVRDTWEFQPNQVKFTTPGYEDGSSTSSS